MVVGGADRGYGTASATRLAIEGAEVVLVDREPGALEEVAADLVARGARVHTLVADIGDEAELRAAADACAARGIERVAVLVDQHVATAWGTVETLDIDELSRVVHDNVVGPIAATRAFLPLLKQAAPSAVVLVGSVDGLFGNPLVVGYSCSKASLAPMARIMAREFAPYDVRVNAVASCVTNQQPEGEGEDASGTFARNSAKPGFPGPDYVAQLRAATPLKRTGPPEEWAGTVAYLASTEASYVTGTVVVVDCGRTGLTPGTFPWLSPSTT